MSIKRVSYLAHAYEHSKPPLDDTQRAYVSENRELVLSLAHKLSAVAAKEGLDFDDLVSAGYEGLISAARAFDPDREGAEFTKGTLNYNSVEGYMIIAINKEKRKGFAIGKALIHQELSQEQLESGEQLNTPLTATAKYLESNIHLSSFSSFKESEDEVLGLDEILSAKSSEDRGRETDRICKQMRDLVSKYITDCNELKVIKAFFSGYNLAQIAKEWYLNDGSRTPQERSCGIKQAQVQRIYDRVVSKLQSLPQDEFLLHKSY